MWLRVARAGRTPASASFKCYHMSRGAGTVERRIAELFAATRDRALSIDEIAGHAFDLGGQPPTRAQRLSATRAAHRLLRRVREAVECARKLINTAHANTKAVLGRERQRKDSEYDAIFGADPARTEGLRLYDFADRVGRWCRFLRAERRGYIKNETDYWCTTTINGRLWFHPPDVPKQVWAVTIDAGGVHWFDAEITRITELNVMVRYHGELARLARRRLWHSWAWWRGVRFVSSRTGRIAAALDASWWKRYGTAGGAPPAMQMPLEQARLLLGLAKDYTREDVIAAFRRKVKAAHPDLGGTAEQFRLLVEARDRLLTALGTSAPPPKPPDYAPKGVHVVYRVGGRSRRSLGAGTRRLTSS